MGVARALSGNAASSCRIHGSVTPSASAMKLARWIVEPSAMGSVNGTPISTTSQTDATAARLSANWRRVGNPAVRNPTSAGRPWAAAAFIAVDMLSRGRTLRSALEHGPMQDAHIFVAAPGTADENPRAAIRPRIAARAKNGMRGLYGRQNTLALGALGEGIESLFVGRRFVGDPPALHE